MNGYIRILIAWLLGACSITSYFPQSLHHTYIPMLENRHGPQRQRPIVGVWIDGPIGGRDRWLAEQSVVEVSTRYNDLPAVVQLQINHRVIVGVHSQDPEVYRSWASIRPAYIEVLSDGFYNEPEMYMTPGEYAGLLRAVYPIIKGMATGSHRTMVIAGALIHPSSGWWAQVQALAGQSYDVVSFHHYVHWPNVDTAEMCQQARYLRQLQTATGLQSAAPVYLTETAVRCSGACEGDFEAGQVAWFYGVLNSGCVDLVGWYTLANNGWENTDMVQWDAPRPVWYEYQALR